MENEVAVKRLMSRIEDNEAKTRISDTSDEVHRIAA